MESSTLSQHSSHASNASSYTWSKQYVHPAPVTTQYQCVCTTIPYVSPANNTQASMSNSRTTHTWSVTSSQTHTQSSVTPNRIIATTHKTAWNQVLYHNIAVMCRMLHPTHGPNSTYHLLHHCHHPVSMCLYRVCTTIPYVSRNKKHNRKQRVKSTPHAWQKQYRAVSKWMTECAFISSDYAMSIVRTPCLIQQQNESRGQSISCNGLHTWRHSNSPELWHV